MTTKVLCAETAMSIWLDGTNRQDIRDYLSGDAIVLPDNYESPVTEEDVFSFAESYGLSRPLHLMMPSKASKRRNIPFVPHYPRGSVPPNSFVKISKFFFIACPELALLQIASSFPLHLVVYTINCLCGTFYLDKNNPNCQQYREPITSTSQIRSYIQRSPGVHGSKIILQALQYAVDGCNSPMEASIATIMCLPFARGGYKIYTPLVNKHAKLTDQAKEMLGRDSCRPDFSWESPRKVAVEYDSNLTHLSVSQHQEDKMRANALAVSGYEVRTLISNSFRNLDSMDLAFNDIRSALGLNDASALLDKYSGIRCAVAQSLFSQFR